MSKRRLQRVPSRAVIALVMASCAGEPRDDGADDTPDAVPDVTVSSDVTEVDDTPLSEPRLVAVRAQVDGTWGTWGELQRVDVAHEGTRWTIAVEAGEGFMLGGVEVELAIDLPGATTWLSNGLQSWSQSGALALPSAPPAAAELAALLAARADPEVVRDGAGLSWWWTWVAAPDGGALVAGALDARRLLPSVTAWRAGDDVHLVLRSGGAGDAVAIEDGARTTLETWQLTTSTDTGALNGLLATFSAAIPSRRQRGIAHAPEAGWNSWYELWSDVDEAAVRANATRTRDLLAPLLPDDATALRVVVDDGWQRAWGDWYPNDKFPSGLDGLARDLRSDGFALGVWLAPLLVHQDSAIAREHPDWLVTGARYDHLVEGSMRVLDPFHPDAAAHLRDTAARLVGWGYDLLKIDFLFAALLPGQRTGASKTGLEAYVRALELLREGAGESTVLLAVGSPITPSFAHVDAWRLGGDIAVEPLGPSFPFAVNALRSLSARWTLCAATLCDADPPILRALPAGEVAFGAWVAALAGGAMFLSDDLRALPAERAAALGPRLLAIALSGHAARPLDPLPDPPPARLTNALTDHLRGELTQVAPSRWRLPNGRTLVLDRQSRTATLDRWRAPKGTPWQIQLEGELDRSVDAPVYDVDLFDVDPRAVVALTRAGRIVICYFSAGSWEDWRPDRDAFLPAALGATLAGFDDERWLDIRRPDVRAALSQRLDLAAERGCDAVDPDNVQGYLTDTGFSLTAADQLDFNRWLAAEAHARGLAVGLKNDLDQVAALADDFDFAVNESCLLYDECDLLRPFLDRDKPVFHIEYADEGQTLDAICADPARAGMSTVLKRSTAEVDAWRQACDP